MQVLLTRMRSGNYNPDDKEISSRRKAVGVSSERRRSAPFDDDEEDAYFSLSLPFPFFPPYFEGRPPPSTAKNESQCVMQIASCTSSSNSSSIHKNTQYQHERTNDQGRQLAVGSSSHYTRKQYIHKQGDLQCKYVPACNSSLYTIKEYLEKQAHMQYRQPAVVTVAVAPT